MRTRSATFLVVLSLLASAPAFSGQLERLPPTGETVGDLVRMWQRSREVVRAQTISVDWETDAFLIPAAGSLAGNFGTYFRSDVTLANRKSTAQTISIGWIARGVDNGSSPVQSFSLPASTSDIEPDFVASVLGKSGLGSIVVIARNSAGGIDTTALIDGFSRIWTNQPGSRGTVSQDFAPVDVQDSLATSYGYGLRQDEQYRTNVGLVNLYGTSQNFTVAVIGTRASTSLTATVQPYSMEQIALPSGNYGDLFLRISSGANLNWWSAYGTSIDNTTGDGWVSHVH